MRLWEFERVWESKQRTERLRLKKWRLKRWGRVKREGGGVNGKPCPLGVWVWVSVSEATNWRRVETEQTFERYHILPISLPPLDFLFIFHYNRWFKLGFDATVTGHIMVSFTSSIPFILNFILWWTVDAGVGKVWALGLGLGSGQGMSCSVLTWWTATQMSSLPFYFFIITNSVGSGFPGEIFWNPDPNRNIRVVFLPIRDRP